MINIYIAGMITDDPNYKEHFKEAQEYLDRKGFITINPADSNLNFDLGYDNLLHICYAMIDICEGVYFLDNFNNSKGALLEYQYSIKRGKFLMFEDEPQNKEDYRITNNGMVIKRRNMV
jgi:nucleoside 2-deoxyribosyltransferase